eukprot:TRINITY_DN6620_c0_g1_i7.p1 TRINITY_DN6620_c0_g1~~TRINITY_DN6620_c0_g1_i7.p1  ORF type:complete len:205 (+),score=67.26 TRINITY_DN6620_c0_g1_i7:91-615(+)
MVATRATVGSTAPVTRACMTRLAVTGLHQARCASTAVAKMSELGKLLHKEVAEEQHSMDEEEEEEGGTAFQVEVTVEKDGKSLVFDCHAADDFYIQEVQFNPKGTPGSDDAHYNDIYRGPAFEELDETLQIAFHKYLDERGVGKDVAAFVCAHADAKEQEEYIRWLQTVRNFVN